jgi:acyl carrier protein
MAVAANDVLKSVLAAIAAFNASENASVPAAPDTVLLGAGGAVDSLGLVRLVMMIERQVEDDFEVPVSLTDEKALSQRNSPFRSVGALADYATSLLNEPA